MNYNRKCLILCGKPLISQITQQKYKRNQHKIHNKINYQGTIGRKCEFFQFIKEYKHWRRSLRFKFEPYPPKRRVEIGMLLQISYLLSHTFIKSNRKYIFAKPQSESFSPLGFWVPMSHADASFLPKVYLHWKRAVLTFV